MSLKRQVEEWEQQGPEQRRHCTPLSPKQFECLIKNWKANRVSKLKTELAKLSPAFDYGEEDDFPSGNGLWYAEFEWMNESGGAHQKWVVVVDTLGSLPKLETMLSDGAEIYYIREFERISADDDFDDFHELIDLRTPQGDKI